MGTVLGATKQGAGRHLPSGPAEGEAGPEAGAGVSAGADGAAARRAVATGRLEEAGGSERLTGANPEAELRSATMCSRLKVMV